MNETDLKRLFIKVCMANQLSFPLTAREMVDFDNLTNGELIEEINKALDYCRRDPELIKEQAGEVCNDCGYGYCNCK